MKWRDGCMKCGMEQMLHRLCHQILTADEAEDGNGVVLIEDAEGAEEMDNIFLAIMFKVNTEGLLLSIKLYALHSFENLVFQRQR